VLGRFADALAEHIRNKGRASYTCSSGTEYGSVPRLSHRGPGSGLPRKAHHHLDSRYDRYDGAIELELDVTYWHETDMAMQSPHVCC
jgi:hypothetical protein